MYVCVSVCARQGCGEGWGRVAREAVSSRVWKQSQRSQIHVCCEFDEKGQWGWKEDCRAGHPLDLSSLLPIRWEQGFIPERS